MIKKYIDKTLRLVLFGEYGRNFIPHFKLKIGLPCDSVSKLQYSESIAAQTERKVQRDKNIIITTVKFVKEVIFYCYLQC